MEDTVAAIRTMRNQVLAPRMLVLTVPTAIWHTVHRLVSVVDICLVDVSDPSEHLLWELDLLVQRPDVYRVYVVSCRTSSGCRLGQTVGQTPWQPVWPRRSRDGMCWPTQPIDAGSAGSPVSFA